MGGKPIHDSNWGAAEFPVSQTYSPAFRNRLIQQLTGPHAKSANELSREVGVSQSTLSLWLRQAPTLTAMSSRNSTLDSNVPPKSPRHWTAAEKLAAVQEAATLKDADLGAFLRRVGIHEADLQAWRALAFAALGGAQPKAKTKPASAAETREVAKLKEKVARLERRLSGANALLDLQKKVQELWGDADKATPGSKE